jgi:hypothetical protein
VRCLGFGKSAEPSNAADQAIVPLRRKVTWSVGVAQASVIGYGL